MTIDQEREWTRDRRPLARFLHELPRRRFSLAGSSSPLSSMGQMSTVVIGVISDTHGVLRPEALAALADSDCIIHAGDVGDPGILDKLNQLAPVTAVRGNVDHGQWATRLPPTNTLEVGQVLLYVLHNVHELDLKPEAAGFSAVIYGHSHVPKQEMRNGVLYFNPGSAGPRRFRLPVTVGKLWLRAQRLTAEILNLAG